MGLVMLGSKNAQAIEEMVLVCYLNRFVCNYPIDVKSFVYYDYCDATNFCELLFTNVNGYLLSSKAKLNMVLIV